jgi:hypothetical protein
MNQEPKIHYCGAYWTPKWIKKLLSKRFNEACYMHDKDYDEQLTSRKDADRKFLHRMLETSGSVFWAMVFYAFVRALGGFSWRKD